MSPHDNHRLYFGAQVLFRSDDQGSSWRAISGDLSRNLDRNQLEVMGRVWSVDAVAKNRSTSSFGHIVAISESPLVEGLIYVGTDDGLVQVTEDGGETWRMIESLPGVPGHQLRARRGDFAAQPGRDLRGGEQLQAGRLPAVCAEVGGPWAKLDRDHRRAARQQPVLLDRAGSGRAGAALPGRGVRRVRVGGRGRVMDGLRERAADDRRARPGDPEARGRPGGRDVRAQLLRGRRLHAAAAAGARSGGDPGFGGSHLRGGRWGHVRAVESRRRERERFLRGRQPAVGRTFHLLGGGVATDAGGRAGGGRAEGAASG